MKNNLASNYQHEKNILEQLPGLVFAMDFKEQFTYCNHMAAIEMGFKTRDNVIGAKLKDVHCKAVECADIFAQQNIEVIKTRAILKIIDIHPFVHGVLSTLTTKSPFHDSINNEVGVIAHAMVVTPSVLFNVSMAIANSDKRFRYKSNVNQRSYHIINQYNNMKLSVRELECLFYLVRGKSAGCIAEVLQLSKRTIEHYIDNLKNKLDCKNKADLIECALQNGFIDFIPERFLARHDTNISIII